MSLASSLIEKDKTYLMFQAMQLIYLRIEIMISRIIKINRDLYLGLHHKKWFKQKGSVKRSKSSRDLIIIKNIGKDKETELEIEGIEKIETMIEARTERWRGIEKEIELRTKRRKEEIEWRRKEIEVLRVKVRAKHKRRRLKSTKVIPN